MLNVLCLYLVNIYLIFSLLYMLYRLVMVGWTPSTRRDKGRLRKHGLPLHTRAPSTTCLLPPLSWGMPPPSLLIHIPRGLLWYLTSGIIIQSLSLHSPSSLIHLHPHLQEMRLAPHLYLLSRLPLLPVSLVCNCLGLLVHLLTRLHQPASRA